VIAGFLWDRLGAASTFHAGAVFSVAALLSLWLPAAPRGRGPAG
jgi:hypothetical protein